MQDKLASSLVRETPKQLLLLLLLLHTQAMQQAALPTCSQHHLSPFTPLHYEPMEADQQLADGCHDLVNLSTIFNHRGG